MWTCPGKYMHITVVKVLKNTSDSPLLPRGHVGALSELHIYELPGSWVI